MPLRKGRFASRFGRYLAIAYVVLGVLLVAVIIGDSLSESLGAIAAFAYVAGLFVLAHALGHSPPFGYKTPSPQERSAAIKDLLLVLACVVGAVVVVVFGVVVNPTSSVGVLLVAVLSIGLVLLSGIFLARALSRFFKNGFSR